MVKSFFSIVLAGSEQMRAFGQRLANLCRGGENIFLSGCLGAGKTCLVQGLAQGLGIAPAAVTSPTFVLHAQYTGRLILHHLDFYRLFDSPRQSEALTTIDELLSAPDAVCAVEWPEALPDLRLVPALTIAIDIVAPAERRLTLAANDDMHSKLLQHLDA